MAASVGSNTGFAPRSDAALSLSLLAILMLLLVPLPSALLDMLLVLNLGVAILLLLVTLNARRPLELSVFPSLLLLLTLYRLSLNVATTRLILLDGDAGKVVSTFGNFVVGGNLVVGLVIFLILIVIQFIVITKGATRISEVNARFVLDAMPGKQMAIDAELGSGAIDDVEAKARREELTSEAEFYGAMDGAGKFVRGDAIAGLIVTGVNLVGGVVLGVSNGLTMVEALRRYSILTVGDGLVSQIPALIIATTAGILVTKNTSESSLGNDIGMQVMANRAPLLSGAIVLVVLSFAPGLPKLPFWLMALGLLALYRKAGIDQDTAAEEEAPTEPEPPTDPDDEHLRAFSAHDPVALEIGARLIPLAMPSNADGVTSRIASMRRELTNQFGIWVPSIRIRDAIQLSPCTYRILINGRETAQAEVFPDKLLA
ncbi:MAG: FHIPEP family type III secretion protein, partial [Planctomycetaceae bacterium]